MVSFPSGSETISGYLALPEGGGKKPAIVVIQEWWGLNDFVKGKADGFAETGLRRAGAGPVPRQGRPKIRRHRAPADARVLPKTAPCAT